MENSIMQKGHNNVSVQELIDAYLSASSKNEAKAEALWRQITQLRVRDTPIDWNEMNDVADWVVGLQTRKSSAPENLIQKAIEAGTRFLTVPSDENKVAVDGIMEQVAQWEKENIQNSPTSRKI